MVHKIKVLDKRSGENSNVQGEHPLSHTKVDH
jgi:hypothetical protein